MRGGGREARGTQRIDPPAARPIMPPPMGGATQRRAAFLNEHYPRKVQLEDRSIVEMRPLKESDEKRLAEFFARLPLPERRLFKDDVTNREVIAGWCRKINYEVILPILAVDKDRIVGDATLHREKRGWMSHVARVRVSVDPDARGRGLATRLVQEIITIAPKFGIAILDAEILAEQRGGVHVFEELHFVNIATLPQHALDLNRQAHDVLVYSLNVMPPERLAVDPDEVAEDIDVGGAG